MYVVPGLTQETFSPIWDVLVEFEPNRHSVGLGWDGNDTFSGQFRSVREGCRDMLRSERRILVEYPFGSFSGGEIVENNRYGDARASEANRPMHDLRIAADVEFPVHHSTLYVSEPI